MVLIESDYSTAKASAKGFSAVFRGVLPIAFAKLAGGFFLAYGRSAMKRNIVIYRDEGVGEFGLQCLEKFFKGDDVWLATAEAVIDGRVLGMADIFVMPGGADLPYCKKLNGAGNENIRAYVEEGGTYLGLCAGAYYGCRALEFHAGRDDEIAGPRELALLEAVAYGSLPEIAPPYDLTPRSAGIAKIAMENGPVIDVFYHGGPAFRDLGRNVRVLARYEDIEGRPPAIIEGDIGEGRAILCGVHPEIAAEYLPAYPVENEEERAILQRIEQNLGAGGHDLLRRLTEGE